MKIYTVDELSTILNVKKTTIYKWIHYERMDILSYLKKLGKRWIITEADLDQFINDLSYGIKREGRKGENINKGGKI